MAEPAWEYAPAPESAALANLRSAYRPFVDGEFVDGGGEPLKTREPGHRGGARGGRYGLDR